MFRKIVTELAYSPALAEELASYARQLRKEKTRRQIGLIFLALGFAIQLLVTLSPPQSANASDPTAFIDGGIKSVNEYLRYYDRNTENIKDLLESLGITRSEVQSTTSEQLDSDSTFYLWSQVSHGDRDDMIYTFQTGDQSTMTAYYQLAPLKDMLSYDEKTASDLFAYTGSSTAVGRFALLKRTGNLVTEAIPQPNCQASTPLAPQAPEAHDEKTECPTFTTTLSATNITTNSPAADYSANASDRILYALTVTNTSDSSIVIPLHMQLWDLLEYAQVLDKGGGELNSATQVLTWPASVLEPGNTLTRDFVVQLLPSIPSTARGQHDTSSYDCIASTSFGNTIRVPISCPFPKAIERAVQSLSSAPVSLGLVFVTSILLLATYYYARTRQQLNELRRIQHNQSGSI